MAKTSRDAWKHYRAWIDFFGAIEDVISGQVLEEFIRLYKEQKAIRQSLRRLVSRGFIKENEKGWKLTNKGKRFFERAKRKSPHRKVTTWDGKWRLVSFDVPIDQDKDRYTLRALLLEFDFLPLQKSVWISPFAAQEDFINSMMERDLWQYCKLMVVDILEGDAELRRRFELPPPKK